MFSVSQPIAAVETSNMLARPKSAFSQWSLSGADHAMSAVSHTVSHPGILTLPRSFVNNANSANNVRVRSRWIRGYGKVPYHQPKSKAGEVSYGIDDGPCDEKETGGSQC